MKHSSFSYRVSAIVSTYNSELFIDGCLQDLISQTLYAKNELEIIVIDSASPQNEGDIVKQYAKKHRHIVYLRTDERETLYAAWNRGIRMARGIYVTNANTDDRHHPEALEKLAATLDANPDIMLAYAHCKVSATPNATWTECAGDEVYRYPFYFPPLCLLHYMFGPQPLWRKEIHERIGEFDPTLFAVGDLDFNIRFCLAGLKAVLVPEVLGLFLKSATSITSSFPRQAQEKAMIMRKWRHSENVLKLFEAGGHHATSPAEQASLLNDFAIDAMSYTTPWNRHESAPILALDCMASALTLAPDHSVIQKNLRILKSTMTKSTQTKLALNRIRPKIETPSKHACSTVAHEIKQQQRDKQAPKGHTISFFADKTDHFHFIKPWLNHFAEHDYTVQVIKSEDIKHKGLHYFLTRCDIAWFEWGCGHIVEASQLPKTCKIVCRVHRYEVYQPRMAQVNWSNVDYAIFVNARFIDEYKLVSGIDLQKFTEVIEIPNPLLPLKIFHDRVPGYNIAHISRFHPDKNPLLALQILAMLVLRDKRYKLYMIGGVQDIQLYHACLDFIAKQELQDNFVYEGINDDVERWLLNKSFILSTSLVESQGMAVLEAMRQGIKPIVYSGFGMERTFAPEHMFRLPEEAINMISSQNYDSWRYRKEALARFDAQGILRNIDQITRDLFKDTQHRASRIKIDAGHSPQHQSLIAKSKITPVRKSDKNYIRIDAIEVSTNPFISICIPTYNRKKFISSAIKSANNQSYKNFEIIIVDDGSSDNTRDLVASFEIKNLKYIEKEHTGAPDTRNRCIRESKGDFILWLDSDDFISPKILEEYVNAMTILNNVDVFYSNHYCIDDSGYILKQYTHIDWYHKNNEMLRKFITKNPIPNPGTLIRKNIYSEIGDYDTNFPRAHDMEFWSRVALARKFNCKHVDKYFNYIRFHNKNITGIKNPIKTDFSYETRITKTILQKTKLEDLFDNLNWKNDNYNAFLTAYLRIIDRFIEIFALHDALLNCDNYLESDHTNIIVLKKRKYILELMNDFQSHHAIFLQIVKKTHNRKINEYLTFVNSMKIQGTENNHNFELNDSDIITLLTKHAKKYFAIKNYNISLYLYLALSHFDPVNSNLLKIISMHYLMLGDPINAMHYISQASTLSPSDKEIADLLFQTKKCIASRNKVAIP